MSPSTSANLTPYHAWRGTDVAGTAALKPLTPFDLGMSNRSEAAGTKALQPLAYNDFVPGVKQVATTEHEQLVEQTQKWVAQTFYGTILKQMHDSPFKSDLFNGGRGGEAFSGLYDQQLTERMAKAGGNKLVNGIVRRIEARQAYARQKKNESSKEGMDATNNAKLRGDRGNDGAAAGAVPAALRA